MMTLINKNYFQMLVLVLSREN